MKIQENISWKVLQDKVVAVNTTTGIYYTMNAVASEIWQSIAGGADKDAILAKLKENYHDVEEAMLVADLDEQIQYWVSENLIV